MTSLARFVADEPVVVLQRPHSDAVTAAGPAHTPAGLEGAHQLHEYWTRGEGLAKWADSPTPWTTLHEHLLKFMPDLEARATAAAWYHDVFGTWPGHHNDGHGIKAKHRFDPSEPRVPGGPHGGEWGTGGPAGGAFKDTLKLAGKIDLGPDEQLVGSDKLLADDGTIRMALTETHGVKSLRLGIGGRGFGSREDEAGPWRGSDNTTATNIEQKKLRDEEQSLTAEWGKLNADPHADPARKAAVDKRLGELANVNTSDIHASGYTASLDQRAVQQLRSTLAKAATDGAAHEKQVNADWDRSEELDRQLNELDAIPSSSDKWTPELKAKYAALLTERQDLAVKIRAQDWTILAEGSIPGQGGDVHYRVDFDDPTQGVGTYVGVIPHGSGLEFTDLTGNEMAASLDPAETKKFLTLLGKYSA